ncbi:MAG: hypothetical protein J5821_03115 [Alphaproteobacteria bacterium]|nr:hypothetical protein [Alphaproteobacteria bacterium]
MEVFGTSLLKCLIPKGRKILSLASKKVSEFLIINYIADNIQKEFKKKDQNKNY